MSWIAYFILSALTPITVEVKSPTESLRNQFVELVSVQDSGPGPIQSCTTSARGRCSFQIDSSVPATYAARTIYDGVPYISEIFAHTSIPPKTIPIVVYKKTASVESLNIQNRSILFRLQKGRLQVFEEIVFENSGQKTIAADAKDVPFIELSDQAYALNFELPRFSEDVQMKGQQIRLVSPFLPGLTRIRISYFLHMTDENLVFQSSTSNPIRRLAVSVDESLQVSTTSWNRRGSKFFQGRPFSVFDVPLENPNKVVIAFLDLPIPFPWRLYVPALGLLFLLIVFVSKPNRTMDQNRKALLASLRRLHQLRKWGQISSLDFEVKRIELLQELAPENESSKESP